MKLNIRKETKYFFNRGMKDVTAFGTLVFSAILFLFLLIINEYNFAFTFLAALIVMIIIEFGIKLIYKKKRPDFNKLRPSSFYELFEQKTSFPSGHSSKIALITTVIHLQYSNIYLTLLLIFITILVGISRVALERHYWKDVIVGYLLGSIVGYISSL